MTKPPAGRAATRRAFLSAFLGGAAFSATRLGRAGRAVAQTDVPAFEVTANDIAQIRDLGGRLHIALTPAARARFATFTAEHMDRLARVTAGSAVLVEAVVRAEIDSGLFSSAPLDANTRRRVFRLLIGR